jgi:tRNA1Val (adenine37-N6)-methyltransferase
MGITQSKPFFFKQFVVHQEKCVMKVGTDGVLLGAWADVAGMERGLDIGTGSGLIALMLAQRAPGAVIHAVEIDDRSCQQARENAQRSPWAGRLQIHHAAIQDYVSRNEGNYDLIVSNPPFFSGGTFSHNQERNSVRHTIKLPHGDLLTAARSLLSPRGRFSVVLPYIEGLRFQELAQSYRLYCTRMVEVRPRPNKPVERLLLEFGSVRRSRQQEQLVIQEAESDEWTEEYKTLTRDFYLKI